MTTVSIAALARAVASGQASAEEVLREHLARLRAWEPQLGAYRKPSVQVSSHTLIYLIIPCRAGARRSLRHLPG